MLCWKCGRDNPLEGTVGRNEVCAGCGFDLRCCRNCTHCDPALYNACGEPQAERVTDKEKRNFCDFFSAAKKGLPGKDKTPPPGGDARSRLESLFKK